MENVTDIIVESMDRALAEQSGWYESLAREYLPAIADRIQQDLADAGFIISQKPSPPPPPQPQPRPHHGK